MSSELLEKGYEPREVEKRWYAFWEKEQLFAAKEDAGDNTYSIVIPPPNVTGVLHLGSVRTALFCWLYSRHCDGKFVLRIEDTDRERSTPENVEAILAGMVWLGMEPDEGPFFQTDRVRRQLT